MPASLVVVSVWSSNGSLLSTQEMTEAEARKLQKQMATIGRSVSWVSKGGK